MKVKLLSIITLTSAVLFTGCLETDKKMVTIDGQKVSARFFKSQSVKSNDSQKTKELKNLLLDKKLYRAYADGNKYSHYFSSYGAQKSANLDDSGKESSISFEEFTIKDYHITIDYYKTVECDYIGNSNNIITLKCQSGNNKSTWRLAKTLQEAKDNLSTND